MLEFFAGFALGFATLYAAEVWRGRRISTRQRRQMARFADFQRSAFDVQDAVAMGLSDDTCNQLRIERDQAISAYLAAM